MGVLTGAAAWCALGAGIAAADDAASPVVPHTAGMMGAVEAPDAPPESALPRLIQVGGALLLAGGTITAARSWVSPATAG